MKKLAALCLTAVVLISLCGVSAAADTAEEIPGTYTLINMIGEGLENMEESLRAMANMGMTATLTVAEDGSATLDLFDEQSELSFDFDAGIAAADGETLPFALEDGVLILGDEESALIFSRSGFGEDPIKDGGPFRLFVLSDVVDAEGNSVAEFFLKGGEEPADIRLFLFEGGAARLSEPGNTEELRFDFDAMTVSFAEGGSLPFTLEETTLRIEHYDGDALILEQDDPGFAGPYVMTAMVNGEEGDVSDQLPMLEAIGMLPTMVVNEDGEAKIDLFGTELEILFDFDDMTAAVDGESIPFTYEYGVIMIREDDSCMSFSRVLEEDAGS